MGSIDFFFSGCNPLSLSLSLSLCYFTTTISLSFFSLLVPSLPPSPLSPFLHSHTFLPLRHPPSPADMKTETETSGSLRRMEDTRDYQEYPSPSVIRINTIGVILCVWISLPACHSLAGANLRY